jgi:hypothetical protein
MLHWIGVSAGARGVAPFQCDDLMWSRYVIVIVVIVVVVVVIVCKEYK